MAKRFDPNNIDESRFFGNIGKVTLSSDELERIKTSFKNYFKKSKKLNFSELMENFRKYGIEIETPEYEEMMKELNEKGEVAIDFDQLIEMIIDGLEDMDSREVLIRIFELFLPDEQSDKIDFERLKELSPGLSDEEVQDMINKATREESVNFEDFCNMVGGRF